MSRRMNKGLWFLRVFTLSASLASVLYGIDYLRSHHITVDALTGVRAEEGIRARVIREDRQPAAQGEGSQLNTIDKVDSAH